MTPEHAWLQIQRSPEHEKITMTLTVGSFKNPLVIAMDTGDWSKMLSNPGAPVQATVTFEDVP